MTWRRQEPVETSAKGMPHMQIAGRPTRAVRTRREALMAGACRARDGRNGSRGRRRDIGKARDNASD